MMAISCHYKYIKLFPKITNGQSQAMKNNNVQLKMYNKTTITQLGTCIVELEHKNNKKNLDFL